MHHTYCLLTDISLFIVFFPCCHINVHCANPSLLLLLKSLTYLTLFIPSSTTELQRLSDQQQRYTVMAIHLQWCSYIVWLYGVQFSRKLSNVLSANLTLITKMEQSEMCLTWTQLVMMCFFLSLWHISTGRDKRPVLDHL